MAGFAGLPLNDLANLLSPTKEDSDSDEDLLVRLHSIKYIIKSVLHMRQ